MALIRRRNEVMDDDNGEREMEEGKGTEFICAQTGWATSAEGTRDGALYLDGLAAGMCSFARNLRMHYLYRCRLTTSNGPLSPTSAIAAREIWRCSPRSESREGRNGIYTSVIRSLDPMILPPDSCQLDHITRTLFRGQTKK
jgi:hypothetical protein